MAAEAWRLTDGGGVLYGDETGGTTLYGLVTSFRDADMPAIKAAEDLIRVALTIAPTARIEVVDLRPGDTIIATVPERTTDQQAHALSTQLEATFPGHTVVITQQVHIDFARDQS